MYHPIICSSCNLLPSATSLLRLGRGSVLRCLSLAFEYSYILVTMLSNRLFRGITLRSNVGFIRGFFIPGIVFLFKAPIKKKEDIVVAPFVQRPPWPRRNRTMQELPVSLLPPVHGGGG